MQSYAKALKILGKAFKSLENLMESLGNPWGILRESLGNPSGIRRDLRRRHFSESGRLSPAWSPAWFRHGSGIIWPQS